VISFVNHSKFLALHQIFERKKNIRKRKNEGRKPKKIENIMNTNCEF